MTHPSVLSGYWTGWYSYDTRTQNLTVPFSASLDISMDGSLSGTTLEPNTFAPHANTELSAQITGEASSDHVRFTKVYDFQNGVHRTPILYAGAVMDEATRIIGEWELSQNGLRAVGMFELVRVSLKTQAENTETVPELPPSQP